MRITIVCVICILALARPLFGEVIWNVNIVDPENTYASYHQGVSNCIVAAGKEWGKYLISSNRVDLEVRFEALSGAAASATSETSQYIGIINGFYIHEFPVAHRIRTGYDVNGSNPDGIIRVDPNFFLDYSWLDPNPQQRTASVPYQRVDFITLMTHEIGHLLGFSGWQNYTIGNALDYKSRYDLQVVQTNDNFYFTGASAQAVYGGPVPLLFGHGTHVGNYDPRPGQDLVNDLMYISLPYGNRVFVSPIDLAILSDCKLPLRSLVPAQLMLNNQTGTVEFLGEPGRSYDVQKSSNLIDWQTIQRVQSTNSVTAIMDTASVNESRRFYRVVSPN